MLARMLPVYIAIFFGGAIGSVARFGMAAFIAQRFGETFPLGTVLVNILGSFLIGLIAGTTNPDNGLMVSPVIRQGLMTGVMGGFTTFSSFSLQTINLLQDGEIFYASLNVVISVVACLLVCWLGIICSHLFLPR